MANGKKSSKKTQNPVSIDRNDQSAEGASADQDGGPGDDCFVTKSYVRELLKVQESMFRSLFESTLESVTSRVDSLSATLQSVKASLEFTQNEVADLTKAKGQARRIEAELDQVQDQIDYHRGKLEYLENQSRRNNIRIDGIAEEGEEGWEETEMKTKEALESSLELPFSVNIVRAHRTAARRQHGRPTARPRTIVCCLANWKQKEQILKAARRIKPRGIFVNEDLAADTLEKRKEQMPKLREAKEAGKIAYFVLDRLVIKNRPNQA